MALFWSVIVSVAPVISSLRLFYFVPTRIPTWFLNPKRSRSRVTWSVTPKSQFSHFTEVVILE